MFNPLKHFFLIPLWLLSGLLLGQQAVPTPSITVQGTAIKYLVPDEATLNLNISKKANSLQEVRDQNAATTKRIMTFLAANGVDKKDIQTRYINIGPKVDYKTDRVQYFTSSQRILVKLKDLNKYDRIVDGLIGLGVYSIGNPQFGNSKLMAARNEVKRLAMTKAKKKAMMLAKELDQTIGKAIAINEVGLSNTGAVNRSMARSMESASVVEEEQSFAPGQIQVRGSIQVTFELK